MNEYKIKNVDFLKIENKYYGLSQEWFKEKLQQRAGCGATVAATILTYYKQKNKFENLEIEKVLPLMEDLWIYLFPTKKGLNSTKLFFEGLKKYYLDRNLKFYYDFLDIEIKNKISLETIVNFLEKNLAEDKPVAFLNLCNGAEKNLDKWHWVTIYEIFMKNGEYFINILDDKKQKEINLNLWYNTITDDGGFVSFK